MLREHRGRWERRWHSRCPCLTRWPVGREGTSTGCGRRRRRRARRRQVRAASPTASLCLLPTLHPALAPLLCPCAEAAAASKAAASKRFPQQLAAAQAAQSPVSGRPPGELASLSKCSMMTTAHLAACPPRKLPRKLPRRGSTRAPSAPCRSTRRRTCTTLTRSPRRTPTRTCARRRASPDRTRCPALPRTRRSLRGPRSASRSRPTLARATPGARARPPARGLAVAGWRPGAARAAPLPPSTARPRRRPSSS